jgi:hypothetical protein
MAFLAADSDLVLEMGKAAREKVAEFSCNAFVDKLDNILEEVARDGR